MISGKVGGGRAFRTFELFVVGRLTPRARKALLVDGKARVTAFLGFACSWLLITGAVLREDGKSGSREDEEMGRREVVEKGANGG